MVRAIPAGSLSSETRRVPPRGDTIPTLVLWGRRRRMKTADKPRFPNPSQQARVMTGASALVASTTLVLRA